MFKILTFFVVALIFVGEGYSSTDFQDAEMLKSLLPTKISAQNARKLINKATWAAFGTVSTDEKLKGGPMVTLKSIADGKINGKSTGTIYFLLTDLDFTGKDIKVLNKTTVMISQDQDLTCTNKGVDPMEPTCARVYISGSIVKMDESFADYESGLASFIDIHPAGKKWMEAHVFRLCKVQIEHIYILDFYGAAKVLTAEQYYNANIN